jgi:hypothetical protein
MALTMDHPGLSTTMMAQASHMMRRQNWVIIIHLSQAKKKKKLPREVTADSRMEWRWSVKPTLS